MKRLFIGTMLSLSCLSAFAEHQCEIGAFGKIYFGSGNSRNAAKVDAHLKCLSAGEMPMFCKIESINTCYENSAQSAGVFCEITAINKIYNAIRPTEELSSQDVRTQCLGENNPMFCKPSSISCLVL